MTKYLGTESPVEEEGKSLDSAVMRLMFQVLYLCCLETPLDSNQEVI